MREEVKSIAVAPDEDQEVITKHAIFGWKLKSSQDVFSRDSHLEERYGEIYSVTTTRDYVKLIFQRDADRPELSQTKDLETEYWNLYERTKWKYMPKKNKLISLLPLIICGIAVFGALYSLFASVASSFGERIVAFLIFLAAAVVMFGISYGYKHFVFAPRERKFFANCNRKEAIEKEVQEILK